MEHQQYQQYQQQHQQLCQQQQEGVHLCDVLAAQSKRKADYEDLFTAWVSSTVPVFKLQNCKQPYPDFLHVPFELIKMRLPQDKRKVPRGGVFQPFPVKLYAMLFDVERTENTNIVRWHHHGRSFQIESLSVFVSEVMPRYFKQSKFSSFQRQLNLYGFEKVTCSYGAYYHPMFLRSRPDLCSVLFRTPVNGVSSATVTLPRGRFPPPTSNFDSLPMCPDFTFDDPSQPQKDSPAAQSYTNVSPQQGHSSTSAAISCSTPARPKEDDKTSTNKRPIPGRPQEVPHLPSVVKSETSTFSLQRIDEEEQEMVINRRLPAVVATVSSNDHHAPQHSEESNSDYSDDDDNSYSRQLQEAIIVRPNRAAAVKKISEKISEKRKRSENNSNSSNIIIIPGWNQSSCEEFFVKAVAYGTYGSQLPPYPIFDGAHPTGPATARSINRMQLDIFTYLSSTNPGSKVIGVEYGEVALSCPVRQFGVACCQLGRLELHPWFRAVTTQQGVPLSAPLATIYMPRPNEGPGFCDTIPLKSALWT